MSRSGRLPYGNVVRSSGRHLQTLPAPRLSIFISELKNHRGWSDTLLNQKSKRYAPSRTRNRKYLIISKTLRRDFFVRSLVSKLHGNVWFYSVFVVFGQLWIWVHQEHMRSTDVPTSSEPKAYTSVLDNKTGPRSIGPQICKLGVHFYSPVIRESKKTRVLNFEVAIKKIPTVTFSKTIIICS